MTTADDEREPTRDQLLAMAYVDGELASEARSAFETRLRAEPALLREVAELKELELLARRAGPREPMDFEWDRLESEWTHSGGTLLAYSLMTVASVGGALWILWALLRSDMETVPKVLVCVFVAGLGLLLLVTLRARLRTASLDPYRHVKR
jgi:anti-sigma-K factor RskA